MKRRQLRVLMTLCMMMTMIFALSIVAYAEAGDAYTLKISGTYNYASGQEMIEYINAERGQKGVGALVLDKELTDAAMQRAAEIAIEFEHTRPDGKSCFTVCSKANGENIAAGNSTASATYIQWENSSGHYANMINSSFSSIGIGHFKHNGVNYWVQLFSGRDAETVETRTGTEAVTTEVSIVEKEGYGIRFNIGELSDGETLELNGGETFQLKAGMINAGWASVYGVFDASSFNWFSSNTSVATVSSSGLINCKGAGKAAITATAKNGSNTVVSIDVKVCNDIREAVVSGIVDKTYTGKAVTQKVKITCNGKPLVENTDFTVTYKNNIYPGTATVTIAGKGNYTGTISKSFAIKKPSVAALKSVSARLAKGDYDAIHASWSKVKVAGAAVKYKVQYKVGSGKWKTAASRATKNTYTIKGLADGKKCYVKVTPYVTVNKKTYSGKAKTSSAIYTLKKLNRPTVKKAGKTKIKVGWNNISGESGYQISRSTKKTGTNVVSTYATTKGTYKLVKETKGKTYYYKVRAYKNIKIGGKTYKVCGPWSAVKSYKLK